MAETIIEIKNLHKYFGKNEVLKGIDLDIKKGEVVVLDASESILYKNVMCDGVLGGTIADERWIVKDERQVVID